MFKLENQRTGEKTLHGSLNAAKHKASACRREDPTHDRFVIYGPNEVYLGKPGTKPRGRKEWRGTVKAELPIAWVAASSLLKSEK